MAVPPIKRALISVSDKSGIIEFAKNLVNLGVEIISTGGTSQLLRDSHVPHRSVDELTQLPEMLDGRVKTLHPKVHGGILGRRDKHLSEAKNHRIEWIDLVVVNFYPFQEATKKKKLSLEEAIEYVDIGGPTMVRAAAKNFAWVGVVVDPADYLLVTTQIEQQQGLDLTTREYLASKVFALTAHYDAAISRFFHAATTQESTAELSSENKMATRTHVTDFLDLQLEKATELRYGENPHQKACAYQLPEKGGILSAEQRQGKPLSYNNLLDSEAALACVQEFSAPACVIVKHANPCGAAVANNIDDAYARAHAADPLSAFGGIIALNRPCTKKIAEAVSGIFMEVVIAPAFTEEALATFAAKPNLRVLEMPFASADVWEMRFITGGVLMQERDKQVIKSEDLKLVTRTKPLQTDIDTMMFAWQVLKHIKSNGILIAKDNATVGIGAGQVSRIDAVDLAVRKAGERIGGSILASDAFFPFRDSIDRMAGTGIRAIIQPGGSVRDEEVIAACDEQGIAMLFTGKRCFRH